MRDLQALFVRNENIRGYLKQLETEENPETRATLLQLLAEERAKASSARSGPHRPA